MWRFLTGLVTVLVLLVAGVGALASIVTTKIAAVVFRRIFGEDPPE